MAEFPRRNFANLSRDSSLPPIKRQSMEGDQSGKVDIVNRNPPHREQGT